MSSDALPWEDEWGFAEWLEYHPSDTHRTWVSNGVYWCGIGNSPNGDGNTRDEAARDSAQRWCREANWPLPFRPRPDLATVEGCMEAFASKATMIVFRGPTALSAGKCPLHVNIQKTANGPSRDFGKPGQPWTIADLQAAARYVLGIEE